MTNEVKRFRAIPGYHPMTLKLIEYLGEKNPGDFMTDDELAEVAGAQTKPGGEAYAYLLSAIRWQRKAGKDFQRVRDGGGIKCLEATETDDAVKSEARAIHRKTGRTLIRAETVDVQKLPDDRRSAFLARTSQLSALYGLSADRVTKKLDGVDNQEPDMKELLKALTGS